jgi:hypothetical protein
MIEGLAIIALIVFIVGLRALLAEAGAELLADLTFVGGLLVSALLLVGAAIGSTVVAVQIFFSAIWVLATSVVMLRGRSNHCIVLAPSIKHRAGSLR